MEFVPESSETGSWDVSGDNVAGAGLGGLRVDGNIPGADASGVAVAGTSADASGAGELSGGEIVGDGVSLIDGDGDGTDEDAFDDGEGAGDTVGGAIIVAGDCAGAVDAGDCAGAGEADGLVFGDGDGDGTGEEFVGVA